MQQYKVDYCTGQMPSISNPPSYRRHSNRLPNQPCTPFKSSIHLFKISLFFLTLFNLFLIVPAVKFINHNEWHAQPIRRQAPKTLPLPVISENQLEDMLFGTDFQESESIGARAAPTYIGEPPGQLSSEEQRNGNYPSSQPREPYLERPSQHQPEYFPPEVPIYSPPPPPPLRQDLQAPLPSGYVPKATIENVHWSQPKYGYLLQSQSQATSDGVSYYSPQRNTPNQARKKPPVLVISNQVKGGPSGPNSNRPHVEYSVVKGLPVGPPNENNYPPPNPRPVESSYGGSWDEPPGYPQESGYDQGLPPVNPNYGNSPARPPAHPPTHAPPQTYFATSEKNPYENEQPRQPPYPTPPAPPRREENPYAEVPTQPPQIPYPEQPRIPSQPNRPESPTPPPLYETTHPQATSRQPWSTPSSYPSTGRPREYETTPSPYEQTPPRARATTTTPSPFVEEYRTPATTTPSPFVEEYATPTRSRSTPGFTRQSSSTTVSYEEISEGYPIRSTQYPSTGSTQYPSTGRPRESPSTPSPLREFSTTPGTRVPAVTPSIPLSPTTPPLAPPITTPEREVPTTRFERPTPPRFETPRTTPFEEFSTTPPFEESYTSSPPFRTRPSPPYFPPSSPRPPAPRIPSPPGKPPAVFVPGRPFVPPIPPFHPTRLVPPPGLPPASAATPPYRGFTTYTPYEATTRPTPYRPRPSPPPSTLPHEKMIVPNRIRGKAQVVCLENGIEFKINTLFPFTGQIFAHDKKRVDACMHSFEQAYNVSVIFPFNECGVPNAGEENLQTQYHMQIIVMIEQPDRSTSIQSFMAQCMEQRIKYKKKEIPKRIEEALEELRLVPQKLEQKAPIPEVTMKIVKEVEHHKEGDGEEVDIVEIGTPLRIEWALKPESDAYGFHVRNCIVRDMVSGAEHRVIDEKGCSNDINIFAHPHYDTYHDIARVHWHAFKVPDNSQLSIRCDIQICTDIPDSNGKTSCEAIPTPPFCADLITSPMNSVLFDVEGNLVKRHVRKEHDLFNQRVHAEICLASINSTVCERRNMDMDVYTPEIPLPKIKATQTTCPQRIWMSTASGLTASVFIFSFALNLCVRKTRVGQKL